jgi:hypothetical protein
MSKVLSCMSRIGTTRMQSIRAVKIGRNTGPTHWPCILIWVRAKKNRKSNCTYLFGTTHQIYIFHGYVWAD